MTKKSIWLDHPAVYLVIASFSPSKWPHKNCDHILKIMEICASPSNPWSLSVPRICTTITVMHDLIQMDDYHWITLLHNMPPSLPDSQPRFPELQSERVHAPTGRVSSMMKRWTDQVVRFLRFNLRLQWHGCKGWVHLHLGIEPITQPRGKRSLALEGMSSHLQ